LPASGGPSGFPRAEPGDKRNAWRFAAGIGRAFAERVDRAERRTFFVPVSPSPLAVSQAARPLPGVAPLYS